VGQGDVFIVSTAGSGQRQDEGREKNEARIIDISHAG